MIEQRLVAVLLADTTVHGLIGDRLFPVVVRQNTALPALTYARLSGERTYALSGSANWTTVLIGITAWSREYAQARSLADAVRKALDAYGEDDGIEVASVSDSADVYETEADVFGCALNVALSYEEV